MKYSHVNWQWRIIGVSLIGALYIAVFGWNSKPSEHLAPPSLQHLLGTDQLGRDMFTRMIIGSGVTLGLTVVVVVLSVSIGLIFGMMAGLMGRWFDKLCMFVADLLLAIPSFIIALVILGLVSDSMIGLLCALVIGWLGRYLRYFRNLTRDIQKEPFIQYAVLSGNSNVQTLYAHMLPHLLSKIMALVTADFGKIMLSISGLAFLGLGVKPPIPELGTILFDCKSYLTIAPWLFFFPGILLGGYALLFQIINNKIIK